MERFVAQVFTEEIMYEALQHFALEKEYKKLGDFENYVFEVTRGGSPYILRLTHSSHRTKEELLAEIDWMNYLHLNQVLVPKAYESIRGELVVQLKAIDETNFFASLFSKVPGEHVRANHEKYDHALFYKWGQTIGKMHKVTKSYVESENLVKRPSWDEEDIHFVDKYVPSEEQIIIQNANELLQEIQKLEQNMDNYGLIHTDIHSGNFFFDGENIHVFDFDDCCYHWFCSDIAIPLYYSVLYGFPQGDKEVRHAFANTFFDAFLSGYKSENVLPRGWQNQVPLFLRLRDVALYSVLHKKIAPEDRTEKLIAQMNEIKARIEKNEPIVEINQLTLSV
ncbi:hypothetical protein EKG37_09260 [Robertmurraya yapensis]|uniref:Aminoglycoside phosphotransferase domain-containing protein n=1 Tax=Bacillus yapensis TaxID=2492960 RepID=A0A3S0IEY0_9BACI|nr:phosphotransferase [Bacillus yapensis]RTR32342.1 hypothetical protein EKG37_09260 [Bacillus yapensis]TKS96536.1 hypothetical protein FAR12_09260 [Bacillus yapensis]